MVADVGGLSAGVHQVSLQISMPRFISLVNSSQPHTVTVDLQVPATPAATGTPDTGSAATPEPSSEPASAGGEAVTEPDNSGEAAGTASPEPTVPASENSNAPAGGNEDNAGTNGGT
ncbi:hypothetical protein D3C75_1158550 [compost metagenome]